METERRRILRMVAEGQISADEADELLRAMGERRATQLSREREAATHGKKPAWPYVLVVLLVVACPLLLVMSLRLIGLPAGLFLMGIGGLMGVALLIFWLFMLVDCITRSPTDFRLLFTRTFEHEKWIWLAIIVLGQVLGAVVYFIVIRHGLKASTAPSAQGQAQAQMEAATTEETPFVPRKRARPLAPWFAVAGVLPVLLFVAARVLIGVHLRMGNRPAGTWGMSIVLPVVVAVVALFIFWLWMLADCLSRDYREFGTLITSDRSADKLLWVLLVLLLPLVGAIAYHIGVRRRPLEQRGQKAGAEGGGSSP
jgi:ABC-type multidrug transport system fused ATPase/permease subunit